MIFDYSRSWLCIKRLSPVLWEITLIYEPFSIPLSSALKIKTIIDGRNASIQSHSVMGKTVGF